MQAWREAGFPEVVETNQSPSAGTVTNVANDNNNTNNHNDNKRSANQNSDDRSSKANEASSDTNK
jgi:hypothetical protein